MNQAAYFEDLTFLKCHALQNYFCFVEKLSQFNNNSAIFINHCLSTYIILNGKITICNEIFFTFKRLLRTLEFV